MTDDITLVTSFFDVGRKNFKDIPRSNEKYVEYFSFWARIKNKLVVYTDSVMAESVKKIREKFNLLDRTEIIIIDDISIIDKNLLEKMYVIEKDDYFLSFRFKETATENSALYDYVTLLKSWCINDAVKRGLVDGYAAWIDFGFNHGGQAFIKPEDFDFEWKYNFPKDKITCFVLEDVKPESMIMYLHSLKDNFTGGIFIVPKALSQRLWDLSLAAMNSLVDCGFIDDDQVIMMMAYQKDPGIFNLVKCDWFMAIKEYGGEHLTMNAINVKPSLKTKILNKYRLFKRKKIFLKRFKKTFLNNK